MKSSHIASLIIIVICSYLGYAHYTDNSYYMVELPARVIACSIVLLLVWALLYAFVDAIRPVSDKKREQRKRISERRCGNDESLTQDDLKNLK